MYEDSIMLSGVEAVKSFSLLANKYDFSISLIADTYKVDAKSIMSIFSLDLSKPIKVEIEGECPIELMEEIKQYKA